MPKFKNTTYPTETGVQERQERRESAQRELQAAKQTAAQMVEAAQKGVRDAQGRGTKS